MFFKKYFHLSWLQVIISVVSTGFLGILYVHFFRNQITLTDLFLSEGIACALVVLFILLHRSFRVPRDLQIGFFATAIGIAVLFLPFSSLAFYSFIILRGVGAIVFYIPFNVAFFKVQATAKLTYMTSYWALALVPSVVAPLVGGFLFERVGFSVFLAVAFVGILFGIYCAGLVPRDAYRVSLRESLFQLKGLRTITILDGALHRVANAVFLFALLYIKTEVEYGLFLSAAALVALFLGLEMAKVSDRTNRRMRYILPLSVLSGITCFLFVFVHTAFWFLVLAIILRSLAVLVEPIRANILLDKHEHAPANWVCRELYLNIGRSFLFLSLAAAMYFKLFVPAFLFLGVLHVLFPVFVHYKKVYRSAGR